MFDMGFEPQVITDMSGTAARCCFPLKGFCSAPWLLHCRRVFQRMCLLRTAAYTDSSFSVILTCSVFNIFFYSLDLSVHRLFFFPTCGLDTRSHVVALCNPWCRCQCSTCSLLIKCDVSWQCHAGDGNSILEMLMMNCLLAILAIQASFNSHQGIWPSKSRKIPYFISWAVEFLLHVSRFLRGCCILPLNLLSNPASFACLPMPAPRSQEESVTKCCVLGVVQVAPSFEGDSSVCVWSPIIALVC